jgi:hypothetical protein
LSKKRKYSDWLIRQRELAEQAVLFISNHGFKTTIILDNDRPIVRVFIEKNRVVDLRIKDARTRYAKEFWIAPVKQVDSSNDYLFFCKKEEVWLYISANEVKKIDNQKVSDYTKKNYFTVPRESMHNFKRMLERIKEDKKRRSQRRIQEWTK